MERLRIAYLNNMQRGGNMCWTSKQNVATKVC